MVERRLAKAEVAGSSPVSRSRKGTAFVFRAKAVPFQLIPPCRVGKSALLMKSSAEIKSACAGWAICFRLRSGFIENMIVLCYDLCKEAEVRNGQVDFLRYWLRTRYPSCC